jgi:peptide deformylase
MKLVSKEDPILTETCKKVDFTDPPFDLIEFSQELVKFMYENNGIGIAANQVGVPYRIFAMRGSPQNFVCINPRIVQPSEQLVTLEESCLTFKGLYVKIKRSQHVRVRFATPNGDMRTETFTGMTARIFQQQLDYLDGILYHTRANRYHREQAFKKWKKQGEHILSVA